MSLHLALVSQGVSRGSMLRSKLPPRATRLQHTVNNIASAPGTKLLYIGEGLPYALTGNNHIQTITWIDEDMTRTELDAFIFRPEYNLIIVHQHMIKTSLMKTLNQHLAKKTLLVILGSRFYSNNEIISRSLTYNDNVKVVSKLEVRDRDNSDGWGDGVTIFDLTIKK